MASHCIRTYRKQANRGSWVGGSKHENEKELEHGGMATKMARAEEIFGAHRGWKGLMKVDVETKCRCWRVKDRSCGKRYRIQCRQKPIAHPHKHFTRHNEPWHRRTCVVSLKQ